MAVNKAAFNATLVQPAVANNTHNDTFDDQ